MSDPARKASFSPTPLKILLVTGGCCHDYVKQKDNLKAGLEQRANVTVDHVHTPDESTKPSLASPIKSNYANGYNLVIHDKCAAGIDAANLTVCRPVARKWWAGNTAGARNLQTLFTDRL